MNYVFNTRILNERQLYKAVGESRGVTICRAEPPRQEDLDEWGAFELQPGQPPTADIVTATNTAEQREDGLWHRVYEARAFTDKEFLQRAESAVQQLLDDQARSMGYDGIHTAVSYADEPSVEKFQQEGQALRAWRSQVWAACYQMMEDYQAANQADPETVRPTLDEVLAALPEFVV